jgi:hypothetical protein
MSADKKNGDLLEVSLKILVPFLRLMGKQCKNGCLEKTINILRFFQPSVERREEQHPQKGIHQLQINR